ncbi:hypothetical protein ACFLRY_02370 [Bacteroidota bacterium]
MPYFLMLKITLLIKKRKSNNRFVMLIQRSNILSLFFLFVVINTYSQDSISDDTPFRKGRWYLGLDGNVKSQFQTQAFNIFDNINFTNGYNLRVKGGYFPLNYFTFGPLFTIGRQNVQENINEEFELLKIGGWFRYYLAKNSNASLYPDIALVFANYYAHSKFEHPTDPFDLVTKGVGPGVILGLGFDYVIEDIIALEIILNYNFTYFFGESQDQLKNTEKYKQFSVGEIQLTLGFAILLKK